MLQSKHLVSLRVETSRISTVKWAEWERIIAVQNCHVVMQNPHLHSEAYIVGIGLYYILQNVIPNSEECTDRPTGFPQN